MYQGKGTLQDLASEVSRQSEQRLDLKAGTKQMTMKDGNTLVIGNNTDHIFGINDVAHRQISQHYHIPAEFYDRLKGRTPHLLDTLVNGLGYHEESRRLVRTLDGNVRAFLSDRYRVIDNHDVLEGVLPALMDLGHEWEVNSCEVTERKLYLKITFPSLQREVKVDDVVQFGLVISNSEVGMGSVHVAPFCLRLVCINGMTINQLAQRRNHIGRKTQDMSEDIRYYSDETLKADDTAFILKMRDSIRGLLQESVIAAQVERFQLAAGQEVETSPMEAVEVLSKASRLSMGEERSVLNHLVRGGDLSVWGYANAVTRTAQDAQSYDRASELEELGGQVVNWSAKHFKPQERQR